MDTTKEVDLSAKAYNCPNCGAEFTCVCDCCDEDDDEECDCCHND